METTARAGALCTLALLACIAGACRSSMPPASRLLPEALAASVYRAARACERGDPAAGGLVKEILREHPDCVDARRLEQNLRLRDGEAWQVYEEARARRDERPEDPAAAYLLARTIPDRSVQRSAFRDIVDRAPSFFFGQYGLAVSALASGDLREAREAADRAVAIRPDSVDAGLVRAQILDKLSDREAATKLFALLAGTHPDHARAVLAAAEHLLRVGRPEDALAFVLLGLGARPDTPGLLLTAARIVGTEPVAEVQLRRCAAIAARSGEAGRVLGLAVAREMGHSARGRISEDRIHWSLDHLVSEAVLAGDYRTARKALLSAEPADPLPAAPDSMKDTHDRLLACLDAADRRPGDAARLSALSRACLAAGFADEAAVLAARAMALGPADSDAQLLAGETAAWRCFLDDVERSVERLYRYPDGDVDLDGLMDGLRVLSLRRTGEDLVGGMPVQSFPLVGAVARSDARGAPRLWTDRGLLLVLGYRNGIGIEGTMSRLVSRRSDVDLQGEPYDVAFVRGIRLASRTAIAGSVVGGFTLPGWFVVDLDVADGSAREVQGIAARAEDRGSPRLWPVKDPADRRSLWFPGGVRGRLAMRIEDPRSAVLGATLAHEQGHVVDVRRYFPFFTSLPEILLGFVRAGFSPARAEVDLERAAETWALRKSRSRTAALLNTLDLLPYRDDAPPHSIAYAEIVEKIIATLDENLSRYPAIDAGRNLLQQLDRLSETELADLLDRALD